jgi:hypothetical protein
MRRLVWILGLTAVTLAACAADTIQPFAVLASSNGTVGVGEQRLLFALVDLETDEYLAAPDREAVVTLRDEFGAPLEDYPMEFIWTIPQQRGLYSANVFIPAAATYQVTIEAEGYGTAGPVGVVAFEDPVVAQPGEAAPRSVTRTSSDHPDLAVISSDPSPDPEMYQLSIDEAVSNGRPTVIVFATPAWCVSQTCGPLLDQTKALRPVYPNVDFIHVEVYENIQVEAFDDLVVVEAVSEWGLPSEPWVFVIDAAGTVAASFEGVASDEELSRAIRSVAG